MNSDSDWLFSRMRRVNVEGGECLVFGVFSPAAEGHEDLTGCSSVLPEGLADRTKRIQPPLAEHG